MKQKRVFFVPVFLVVMFVFPAIAFSQTASNSGAARPPEAAADAAESQSGTSPDGSFEVFIPSRTRPSIIPGSDPLPRSFRKLTLGMSLDELKAELAADGLFEFRGDRDVSFLPAREENLVETTGLSFIRRAFFQLRSGQVFIMAFSLDPRRVDHYSVFTSLVKKYGEPVSLNPEESVWENEETRVSLERPLTVKYIDMGAFNAILDESGAEASREVFLRQGFLDEF